MGNQMIKVQYTKTKLYTDFIHNQYYVSNVCWIPDKKIGFHIYENEYDGQNKKIIAYPMEKLKINDGTIDGKINETYMDSAFINKIIALYDAQQISDKLADELKAEINIIQNLS